MTATRSYTRFTPELQQQFLSILKNGGSVAAAAAQVGIDRHTVYKKARSDANFKAGFAAAKVRRRPSLRPQARQKNLATAEELAVYVDALRTGDSVAKALQDAGLTSTKVSHARSASSEFDAELTEIAAEKKRKKKQAHLEKAPSNFYLLTAGVRVPNIEAKQLVVRGLKMGQRSFITALARISGCDVDSAQKKVRRVLDGEHHTIAAEAADEIALAAGLFVGQEDVTHVAGGPSAATEMVEAWAPDLTPDDQRALAQTLLSFSRGFVAGLVDRPDLLPQVQEAAA